jgi:UDP-glucuronate 4-epimerase
MGNILVTGAAGFVGSHLCERLLASGHRVIGIDNFDDFYDPVTKRDNIAGCLSNPKFTLQEGDIRDPAFVDAACSADVDTVAHLAARAGVRPSIENPLLYQDVNVNGTCVLLHAARHNRITRFIFASSSSVYGNARKVPFQETDNVDYPISPYAATKKAGELICHTYAHLFRMDVTCLRLFTVYGPRQRPDLAIHKFTRLIEAGRPIPVFGDGQTSRDYTYIDDIVDGIMLAIDRCRGYRIYNLGESRPVKLVDLIAAIEHALGKKAAIEQLPPQPGDVDRTYADIALARRELGYNPSTAIEAGLARFVEWFRTQRG